MAKVEIEIEETINSRVVDYLSSRGLDIEDRLLAGLVCSAKITFYKQPPRLYIGFNYYREGEIVYRKFRTKDGEYFSTSGAKLVLYNSQCLEKMYTDDYNSLFITEGEFDALSFLTAGFSHVVSVPGGAVEEVSENLPDYREDKKFQFLVRSAEELKKVNKFILAVDSDYKGQCLAEELSRRLGKGRCDVLVWPPGIKDANQFLQERGLKEFQHYVSKKENCIKYPIKGLASWNEILPKPVETVCPIGMGQLGNSIKLQKGNFMVVTGIPSHGKSTFVKCLALDMMQRYSWHVTIMSLEDDVFNDLKPELRQMFLKKPTEVMLADEVDYADSFLQEHCAVIFDDDSSSILDMEWVFDMMRNAKLRYNTDLVILDPWNALEHIHSSRVNISEYVHVMLERLKRLVHELSVSLIVVAHPKKMSKGERPTLYDISDSAAWFNKSDIGIVLHKDDPLDPENCLVDIVIEKVRRRRLGCRGVHTLRFDQDRMEFYYESGSSRGES